jgi:hypothetical protein
MITLTGCYKAQTVKEAAYPLTPAKEGTELFGVISKDTTLSGVVRVIKDVYVKEGVTLTILPGTKVIMAKSESTKVKPLFLMQNTEILVRGGIIAKGTKEQKISFVSDQEDTDLKDYAGIILLKGAESHFENCTFKNAETALLAIKAKVNIIDCEFESCFYAVSTIGSDVRIQGADVRNCDKGFYFHKGTTGSVTKSVFSGCQEDAVFISKSSRMDILENVFKDNLWGVSTIGYKGTYLESNEFINNKEDVFELNYH